MIMAVIFTLYLAVEPLRPSVISSSAWMNMDVSTRTSPTPARHGRYYWRVVSRLLAAGLGGYTLTVTASVLLALILPLPKSQAVMTMSLLGFFSWSMAIMWVYATASLAHVWRVLLALILLTGLASTALRLTGA